MHMLTVTSDESSRLLNGLSVLATSTEDWVLSYNLKCNRCGGSASLPLGAFCEKHDAKRTPFVDSGDRVLICTGSYPHGIVTGSAVLKEVIPIIGEGYPTPRLGGWAMSKKDDTVHRTPDNMMESGMIVVSEDDVMASNWAPGRWAWVFTDAEPTKKRCPSCWGAKRVPGWTRGSNWEWVPCAFCINGTCDPIPMAKWVGPR